MQDAKRCLQHTPERQVLRSSRCCEQSPCLAYLSSAFHFGEEDSVSLTARHRRQILLPPERGEPIHPDNEFTPAIPSGAHRFADLLPCRGFGIRGDGILQIKNQPISRQGFGFFKNPPIRPRHIEYTLATPHLENPPCLSLSLPPVSAPQERTCIPGTLTSADSSSYQQNCDLALTAPHRS